MGTPAFVAPEQARGHWKLVDHQSDLYSLGASLFTLMTGKLVHEAGSVADMLVLAITRNPPSLREAMPEAPEALVRAIDGALRLKKSERWANAAAMRAALQEGYLALKGIEAAASRPPERVRRLPGKRWLASLAIVGVAGVALVSDIPRGLAAAAATQLATPSLAASSAAPQPGTWPSRASPDPAPSPPAKPRRYDPIYDRRY